MDLSAGLCFFFFRSPTKCKKKMTFIRRSRSKLYSNTAIFSVFHLKKKEYASKKTTKARLSVILSLHFIKISLPTYIE